MHDSLDGLTLDGTRNEVGRDVVDVDLHPARPGRGGVTGQIADTDVDVAALWSLPPDLVAKEPGAGRDVNHKVKGQRLARA